MCFLPPKSPVVFSDSVFTLSYYMNFTKISLKTQYPWALPCSVKKMCTIFAVLACAKRCCDQGCKKIHLLHSAIWEKWAFSEALMNSQQLTDCICYINKGFWIVKGHVWQCTLRPVGRKKWHVNFEVRLSVVPVFASKCFVHNLVHACVCYVNDF